MTTPSTGTPDPEWEQTIERGRERALEERRRQTLKGRRAARYKFAEERIKKIVDGMPPLTDEQLSKLAVLLQGGGGE